MDMWLFPIEPQYACSILRGDKKYELRNRGYRVKKGSIIVVYAKDPIKAILGEFTAGKPIKETPTKVWRRVGKLKYGITPGSRRYIMGHKFAVAIPVKDPKCYAKPVTLEEIRKKTGRKGWVPRGPMRVKPGEKLYDIIMKARKRYRDCRGIAECPK